jgi:hypothetical protein
MPTSLPITYLIIKRHDLQFVALSLDDVLRGCCGFQLRPARISVGSFDPGYLAQNFKDTVNGVKDFAKEATSDEEPES